MDLNIVEYRKNSALVSQENTAFTLHRRGAPFILSISHRGGTSFFCDGLEMPF